MERLNRKEIKNLTDRELKLAFKRISRDYSHGLINDKVTPVENTLLLEEEIRKRYNSSGN